MSHLSLRPIEHKSRTTTKILANALITKAKTKTAATTTSTTTRAKLASSEKIKIENTTQNSGNTATTTCKEPSPISLLQSKESVFSTIASLESNQFLVAEEDRATSLIFDPQQQHQLAKTKAIIDRKRRRKRKNPRSCSSETEKIEADDSKPMLRTDVEVFQGKIVFNLDGNAFIIATENSTQDLIVNATKPTVSHPVTANEVEKKITATSKSTEATTKSIKTSLTPSYTLKGALSSRDGEHKGTQKSNFLKNIASPRIHSFRIVSAQDATSAVAAATTAATIKSNTVDRTESGTYFDQEQQTQKRRRRSNSKDNDDNDNYSDRTNGNNLVQRSSKIQKPILMCFICKLSFGNTKSFSSHASSEHQLSLQPKEQHLLNREYSSAIIQPPNMDERPQVSFLEPIDMLNVIKSDDLNTETDVQFNEDIPQQMTCEIDSGEMSERSGIERISEKADDAMTATGTNSSMKASTSSSTSPLRSSPMSPDLSLSSQASPKPLRSASTVVASLAISPSQITSTPEPPSAMDCSNNSHLFMTSSISECIRQQQKRYEVAAFVNDATALATNSVLNHSSESTKLDTTDRLQQQQQQVHEATIITNRLQTNSAVENKELDGYKAKATASAESLTSSSDIKVLSSSALSSSLLPKNESEKTSKIDTTLRADSRPTSQVVFGSSLDSRLKPKITVCVTPTTTSNSKNNFDFPSNIGSRKQLYGTDPEDCLSPSLSAVKKVEAENIEMAAMPTNVSSFLHLQLQSDSDDGKLDRSEALSRLSADAVNLIQQQQYLAMSSATFATPPTSHTSIAPTHNSNLSCLQASLAALSDSTSATFSSTDTHKSSAKLISDFLQQHLSLQQQYAAVSSGCTEHGDYKDSECKSCEMQQLKSSPFHNSSHQHVITSTNTTPQRSPTRSNSSCTSNIMQSPANLTSSPNTTAVNVSAAAVAAATASHQQNAAAAVAVAAAAAASVANNTSSFTIGACSDHINGRPLGVECARCEMILNSTRLNTGVQMSTRNSCKTLKCPQCNWHYKYQETLEIHMREKHPDGESACGYCLSGQQHPRLARGESYSCGYKPYRCEICNYSTTTKGNLSIHMQSDKHLNNMQELNSSQNMLAAAVAVASSGKTDVASKMLLSSNIAVAQQQQQQQQQQHQQQQQAQAQQTLSQTQSQQAQSSVVGGSSSVVGSGGTSGNGNGRTSVDATGNTGGILNKNKPSFRCDICSYETSVARNLRIHMTSEKHTHNMAALQNNIKHIQAYSFLQQHQQAVAAAAAQQQQQQLPLTTATQTSSQLPALGSGLASSFIPEIALADMAYNQALMIQLLQHNAVSANQQQTQQHESAAKLQLKTSPSSSPRPMQVEQSATLQQQLQQQQIQQLRQQLQQSYSPHSGSPTLMLSTDPFNTSEINLSSSVSGGCSGDETPEPPVRADPSPTSLYSCLVCDVFTTNSLDELNQHLLIDRSRNNTLTTTSAGISANNSSVISVVNMDVMVILNNNYICRLCNYKTNLKANFQLHSKTDKHLQKLNYINHIREGGPHNEYKLKYLQLAANTVQLKCNCCDFYTNSIQKLSLHTQHMRHETMRMIFQHLLQIMQQSKFEKTQTQQHSKPGTESGGGCGVNIRGPGPHGAIMSCESGDMGDTLNSAITAKDMSNPPEKLLTCQLCNHSTFTLLNMIQHVKSLRHMQVEQFVSLQRRSEQLDPPSLNDVFKVVEQCLLQSLPLAGAVSQEDNNKMGNVRPVSVADYFPAPTTRLPNEETGYNTPGIDHNSFSPSSNSSIASGNTSVRSKGYQPINTPNFQLSIGDRDNLTSALGATASAIGIPSVVFKCNNCDFFAQSKSEMESHLRTVHPQTEPDYISIPTNSAAMQAFQAAVAAATAAAASASATAPRSESNKSNLEIGAIDDNCPNLIKRERLYSPVDEELEKGIDMRSTTALQDAAAVAPWVTTTMSTIAYSPSLNESRPGSHNISGEIEENDEEELQQHQSLFKGIDQRANEMEGGSQVSQTITKNVLKSTAVQCPLCTDIFERKQTMESHLMHVHSVNRDGLARLLQLVDTSIWKHFPAKPTGIDTTKSAKYSTEITAISDFNNKGTPELNSSTMEPLSDSSINLNKSHPSTFAQSVEVGGGSELSCEQCSAQFKHEQELLQHAQKMQHFVLLTNGDHRCLAANHPSRPCHSIFPSQTALIAHYKNTHISLVISERHVYKYRCKHCSLAFKTQEKLSTHLLYHTMRDATKCTLCQRNFRSTQSLQKHMDQTHQNHRVPISSSPTLSSCSGRGSPTLQTIHDKTTAAGTDVAAKVLDSDARQSPPVSPQKKELIDPKNSNVTSQVSSSPSAVQILQDQQQQQVAAITAALLNQSTQQQQHCSSDELSGIVPAHMLQHLQMKPCGTFLTQKYLQQQSLQNLQQLQQLPQLTASATSSGLPLNPVEMLNLMQFHHIMSMNFMNLAPPLIFGVGANASVGDSADILTSPHTTKNVQNPNGNTRLCGTDLIIPGTPVSIGPTADSIGTSAQQQQPQQQQSAGTSSSQMASNQKRARTRITDEQLKILRAHFDINNSPSEESIMEMSQKANLPMKVVKHWFRNTLFKERQRNKDSPYNFNNPPSTTLNLEEYERTGQAKVTPLNEDLHLASLNITQQQHQEQEKHKQLELKTQDNSNEPNASAVSSKSRDSPILIDIKTELFDDNVEHHSAIPGSPHSQQQQRKEGQDKHLLSTASALLLHQRQQRMTAADNQHQQIAEMQEHTGVEAAVASMLQQQHHHLHPQLSQGAHQQQHINLYSYETKSESGSSDILSRPQSPSSSSIVPTHYSSINEMLNQQLDNVPLNQTLTSLNVASMHGNNMGPPKNFQTNKSFEKNSPSSQFDTNSNSSNASSTSSGKRANRTRFTDYQIKVLQEFFENNSYPKDSDLEYLSKLLLLSPRVIVVWFQNARQKQRKIYENQPNNSLYETEEKKHNINYACKKCNLAFQRYYELIRHQKNHCFKEENNKKSAKAQIAAAQIAQNLSSEDSNSSMDINSGHVVAQLQHHQHVATVTATHGLTSSANVSNTSPQHLFGKSSVSITDFSPSTTPTPPQSQRERTDSTEVQPQTQAQKSKFECDKCKIQFGFYEHFREHQLLHLMNPGLFTSQLSNIPDAYGSFGSILQSLQQVAAANVTHQQQQQLLQQQGQPPAKKRKCSENSISDDMLSIGGTGDTDVKPTSSSISTTKNYDFLYQYFMQNETNNELKQQFQSQQQQSQEPEQEMEFLLNFYHQSELRKRSNYDFLYQYYQKNERSQQIGVMQPIAGAFGSENKPHIEFLLQYYQLNESKKFFQLDASNLQINDHTAASPTSTKQNQRTNNTIFNRESATTPKADYSMSDSSLTKQSIDALSSKIELSDGDDVNNENDENSNVGMDVDDADSYAETDQNDDDYRKLEKSSSIKRRHISKTNIKARKGIDHHPDRSPEIFEDQELATNLTSQQHTYFALANEQDILKDVSKASGTYGKSQRPNYTKRKSTSLATQSPMPLTTKTGANISFSSNVGAYIHNLKDFLEGNAFETPQQSQHFNEILTQTDTDGSNCCTGLDKIQSEALSPPPSSNPNNNSSAVGATASKPVTSITEKQQSKRLRTTILPEQLNFLYECYQNESNPSRKMLEEIAKKVNLKKRVVQVWFQNSRAKDKKSRNQRFAAVSDDSNYDDATQCSREGGLLKKNAIKPTNSYGSKGNINFVPDANLNINTNHGLEKGDCNLCQLPQVNTQQHSFSIVHICKVKKLLEQTTNVIPNVEKTMTPPPTKKGGGTKVECDGCINGTVVKSDSEVIEKQFSNDNVEISPFEVNDIKESNLVGHLDGGVVDTDCLCTFTRIYKELRLQNAMKQALGNFNELDWSEKRISNGESAEPIPKNVNDGRHKDQPQINKDESNTEIINLKGQTDVKNNRSIESGTNQCGNQQNYNLPNYIVNHKPHENTYYIDGGEQRCRGENIIPTEPLSTSLTDDEDNDNDDYMDSSDGNTPDLNDNTDENRSVRNESMTTNCSSKITTSTLTATTALKNLSSSHAKDIIKQLFNCSQITAKSVILKRETSGNNLKSCGKFS